MKIHHGKKFLQNSRNLQTGFIGMGVAMIVSVVIFSLATTAVVLAIGELQSSVGDQASEQALLSAEACMENGLLKKSESNAFAGNTVNFSGIECQLTMAALGSDWISTASATKNSYQRRVEVRFSRASSGTITITQWREI